MMGIPSGKRLHNYGKSHFLMGKSAIFNSKTVKSLVPGPSTVLQMSLGGVSAQTAPERSRTWADQPITRVG